MGIRESDLKWTARQLTDVVSWTGISWFVALFAGAWGVMVGIGTFLPAYILLGACIVLCMVKWGHVTNISEPKPHRRISAFVLGFLLLISSGVYMGLWTHGRKLKADEDAKKLEPLTQIPRLVAQVNEIPGLKHQLDALPGMKETIANLQDADRDANDEARKKQTIIEGLAQTVIAQQREASQKSHADIQHTESVLNTNIDRYRTDTTSAAARIMRPPRTLGDKRQVFIDTLKSFGPQDIAITPARGAREAIDFAAELESAFRAAGWHIVKTKKLVFLITDGIGIELIVKKFENVPEGTMIPFSEFTTPQVAVATALHDSQMEFTPNFQDKGEEAPTELYVGLQ